MKFTAPTAWWDWSARPPLSSCFLPYALRLGSCSYLGILSLTVVTRTQSPLKCWVTSIWTHGQTGCNVIIVMYFHTLTVHNLVRELFVKPFLGDYHFLNMFLLSDIRHSRLILNLFLFPSYRICYVSTESRFLSGEEEWSFSQNKYTHMNSHQDILFTSGSMFVELYQDSVVLVPSLKYSMEHTKVSHFCRRGREFH